ncbi:MAG: ATP synthase subunit C [Chlamydiae bacterium]|nr:ATP synthase subunit C [Chlamydiota bacterium]
MGYDMIGPALSLAFSAIGASIGCSVAGMTSHGVMSRIEEGHGKFIGLSAVPASQLIYGFILMLLLRNAIEAGSVTQLSSIFIGGGSGLAIMVAAIYQGLCCATAIQATAKQPSVFGKTFVAIGIVESFALFAFVFALLLM